MKYLSRFSCYIISIIILCSCSGGSTTSSQNNTPTTPAALFFNPSNIAITQNSSTELLLSITGESSSQGVIVSIASSNTQVAVVTQNQCILSNAEGFNSSCEISVKGLAIGTATITATATGVTSASSIATVSSATVPGSLAFTPLSESVIVGSQQSVTLSLNNSSGISDLEVPIINSNPSVATTTPDRCVLSTTSRACQITISGLAVGQTQLTAATTGYSAVTNIANVIESAIIPGTLSFINTSQQIYVNSYSIFTLSLNGSSGVDNLQVTLSTTNSNVAIATSGCSLSTNSPLCYIIVTGISAGTATITASATGYTSANEIADVISIPVPGTFYFAKVSESVIAGASTTVDLIYSGGTGESNVPVTISTNNSNAAVTPTTCYMSNTSVSGASTCTININGESAGQTVITASSSGYPNAINTVTIESSQQIIYGSLVLTPSSVAITTGNTGQLLLTLTGSSNVNNLLVNLNSSDTAVATTTPSCTLSSTNNTCKVTVSGIATGSATISASASQVANVAKSVATVSGNAGPSLVFDPSVMVFSTTSITAQTGTLTLLNPPNTPTLVSFSTTSAEVAYSPGTCTLSVSTPSCTINVNNSESTNAPGNFELIATSSDPTIAPGVLPVYIAVPVPVARTLTVINNCSYTVYPGINGGSFAGSGPTSCPTGATYQYTESSGVALCTWNNPAPTSGSYQLLSNESTQFIIPATTPSTAGVSWSGGLMARLQDKSGNWIIGDCSNGTSSESCVTGFQVPQTVAEFTFLAAGVDSYDIQVINGVTSPTSMGPTTLSPDSANPYDNGVAGSITQQNGTLYTLYASTWVFDPNIPANTNPTADPYYNYVDGDGSISCTTTCTGGKVCGYNYNALNTYSAGGSTHYADYTLSCGYRLAYLTAEAIWKLNPDTTESQSNVAPFSYYTVFDNVPQSQSVPYPNLNGYQLNIFYECTGTLTNSGYQSVTTYPIACGCVNWNESNIATPTEQCYGTGITGYTSTTQGIGFNSAWINQVLPRITWLKSGAPTSYSFPYDDPSSTFQGYVPASIQNPANATNYTITFCPGGKQIPNFPPTL